MEEISFRGGSRIGWVNASYPFAKLTCSRARLTLSSLGRYDFTPEQVVAFGSFGSIPLLANGLAIEHNRADYPARMVFWCLGSRERVLEEIRQVGFVPTGQGAARPRGMPLRWGFVIAVVLCWNLLFLADGPDLAELWRGHVPAHFLPGAGAIVALASIFLLATGIKVSRRLQRLALAPGHELGEVRGMLTLLQLVSVPLMIGFSLVHFLRAG
jgi:hypothetical protein